MDSPQTAKTTTAITNTPSESAILPNSPVFSYISNLSPIKPLKTSHVAQGFPGLSSPPLVFTSPHITPHHEASLFKRQCPQSTSAEVSQHDDSGKKVASDNDVSSKSITQLSRGLIPSSEECDSEVRVQTQSRSSSSGRADEYLADPVELDCENSEHSAELVLEQDNSEPQSSQSGLTDMKKVTSELHNCVDVRENVQMEANAYPSEDLQAKSTSLVKLVETEDKRWVGGRPTIESSDIGSKMCMDYFSEQTQCEHTAPQNVGCHHQNGCSVAPQLLLEPSEMIQEHEDCDKNAGAVLNKPVKHTMLHDLEASQNKYGTRRRCLQFEEVHSNTFANSPSPSNLVDSVTKSWSPATPAHSEVLELTCVDSATSSNRQLVNLPESRNSMFSPCSSGKSSLTVSKPSGIGLHLNRVVSAVPKGCGATKRSNQGENSYMSAQRLKSTPNMNCHLLENTKCNSISSNRASTEVGMHESNALVAASFATSESPHDMKPFYNPVLLEPTEHCATPRDKRKFNSEDGSMFEEFNQLSSKKIRRKASGTADSEGCKRCNCKKTKCLKLYCDCFAAGIYCAEPCACQGCYNRPEYEDTVLETRQQIESRNPYAFAPKIVQHVSESPASSVEDKNRSSARHKRGCNCKKSLCLKKYCECYQANVGCSDGCRCEGCKNIFGRKEDYRTIVEMVSQKASNETLEDMNNDKPKVVTAWKGLSNTELYNLRNVAHLTPLCQFSEHGTDALRSQLVCRTYLPSPESDLTVLSSQRADQCAPSVDSRSPLPDALLTATSSSSSETKEWTSGGSGVFSISQHTSVGSLRWRGSPITPMTRLGSVKFLRGTESEILEDDTPQILKDTCISTTPTKAVLVNSPNRKRVSPPHGRLIEIGSSSAAVGLKSGRKFILRGLPPSFPPLTPCAWAKGGNVENKNDFQDGSGK